MVAKTHSETLGNLMRGLRLRRHWTLREPKVEHDRLTLGYPKLQQVSERLKMQMSELLAGAGPMSDSPTLGRRSFGTLERATHVTTLNFEYFLFCSDLRKKQMSPFVARILTKSLQEFGELVRHAGEEFIYVLTGRVEVHTEFYEPAILAPGECIYIDSNMGHAYVVASGCDEATVLGSCASPAEALAEHFENAQPLGDEVPYKQSSAKPVHKKRTATQKHVLRR